MMEFDDNNNLVYEPHEDSLCDDCEDFKADCEHTCIREDNDEE